MAHRLIIRPEAEADIADAAVWYDDQQSGLGNEFIDQVQVSLNRAIANPYAFQSLRRRPDVRRVLTNRYRNQMNKVSFGTECSQSAL